jgi:hypothetical protein
MVKYAGVDLADLQNRPANGKQRPAALTNKTQDNLFKYKPVIYVLPIHIHVN